MCNNPAKDYEKVMAAMQIEKEKADLRYGYSIFTVSVNEWENNMLSNILFLFFSGFATWFCFEPFFYHHFLLVFNRLAELEVRRQMRRHGDGPWFQIPTMDKTVLLTGPMATPDE